MIDPLYIIKENLDFLIIGDSITREIPSLEIKNWLIKYKEISQKNNRKIKNLSGFYIAPSELKTESLWIKFLQENINAEMINPPILSLKVSKEEFALKNGAYDLVKQYSKDFIDFIIYNRKRKKN